jgi:hypothetical protein
MRCCCDILGVSQPDERLGAAARRGLGSMLAVEEERRERAAWRVNYGRVEGILYDLGGRTVVGY